MCGIFICDTVMTTTRQRGGLFLTAEDDVALLALYFFKDLLVFNFLCVCVCACMNLCAPCVCVCVCVIVMYACATMYPWANSKTSARSGVGL